MDFLTKAQVHMGGADRDHCIGLKMKINVIFNALGHDLFGKIDISQVEQVIGSGSARVRICPLDGGWRGVVFAAFQGP
jgi:hypothetical protein